MEPKPLKKKIMYEAVVYSDASNWNDKERVVEQYQQALRDIKSSLNWTAQTIEYEINKAIRDYHKMEFSNTMQEIVIEKLLIMYIDTAYGCIQTIEEGLCDITEARE